MPEQRRNSAMISTLSGEFQRRYEAAFAWKSACSAFLALPGLRGFWPTSSINNVGNAYDLSGQGNTMSYNGNPTYNFAGLAPYIDLDGTGDYLSRADGGAGAWADILGTETFVAVAARGLTLGGWFQSHEDATNGLICKGQNVGDNATDQYLLTQEAGLEVRFKISSGAAAAQIQTVGDQFPLNAWHFVVGAFDPGVAAHVYVDNVLTSVGTAIGVLNDTNYEVDIGAYNNGGAGHLDGYASLCFLCTALLSPAIIGSLYHQTRAAFGV